MAKFWAAYKPLVSKRPQQARRAPALTSEAPAGEPCISERVPISCTKSEVLESSMTGEVPASETPVGSETPVAYASETSE